MAIKPVGGSKVYVIEGSRRDPRLTSTGQSWANLVSQQKYMLYKEAKEAAIAEMRRQGVADDLLIKEYQAARNDLRDEIQSLRDLDRKYELEEVKSGQKIAEQKAKYDAGIGGGTGSRGGAAGRVIKKETDDAIVDELRKNALDEQNDAERSLQTTKKYKQDLIKEKKDLGDSPAKAVRNSARINEIDQELTKVNQDIANKETTVKKAKGNVSDLSGLTPEQKANKAAAYRPQYERVGYVAPTAGTTKEKEYVPPGSLNLSQQRANIAAQIESRQKALQELQAPQLSEFDLVGRTREIYGEKFGGQPQGRGLVRNYLRRTSDNIPREEAQVQPPASAEMSANRLAELEALGVDEEFMSQYAPAIDEQPVRLEETPAFGRPQNELQQAAALDELAMQQEAARRRAESREPSPLANVYRGIYGEEIADMPDQELEEELRQYDPTFGQVREDRAQQEIDLLQRQQELQALGMAEGRLNRRLSPEFDAVNMSPEYGTGSVVGKTDLGPEYDQSGVLLPSDAEAIRRQSIMAGMNLGTVPQLPSTMRGTSTERAVEYEALGVTDLPSINDFLLAEEKEALPEIPFTLRYKQEVIRFADTVTQKDVDDLYADKKNIPEWAKLVQDLYPVESITDQTKRDELLRNAWEQITITYNDKPEFRRNAHELLLAIDRLDTDKAEIIQAGE